MATPEEVLLPATNGEAGDNEGEIEYLEEKDPMSDNMDGSDNDALEEGKDSTKKTARKPTVVPKKRKGAKAATPVATPHTTRAKPTAAPTKNDDEEAASTSRAAAAKKDNEVDEEQCRVCTTKTDLVSLFKRVEGPKVIADLLMTICPSVSIALKDFMPQFICNACLDKVNIAMQLKTQCETTERELRKKLSRSKNKVRRPVGYVTIDATIDSDPPSDEEPNDDVEFKVSDDASASPDDDSEDSDFSGKRRTTRGAGARRGRRKAATTTPAPKHKKPKIIKRESIELGSDDNDGDAAAANDVADSAEKRKKQKKSANVAATEAPATEFPCDECDQVFQRKLSLVLHKKVHSNEREPINCEICGKQFKIQGAYRTHLQKHKDEPQGHACDKCDEVYASKADLKRHLAEDHEEKGVVHLCKKCQRTFVSETRLEKHIVRCPGLPTKPKRTEFEGHVVGQDLFKTVAPLTTTYWSDSFSD